MSLNFKLRHYMTVIKLTRTGLNFLHLHLTHHPIFAIIVIGCTYIPDIVAYI